MLVGIGLDETGIGSKAFTTDEAGRDACPDHPHEPFARWNIGAAWRYTASRGKQPSARNESALDIKLPWLNITPLERPVVPPV